MAQTRKRYVFEPIGVGTLGLRDPNVRIIFMIYQNVLSMSHVTDDFFLGYLPFCS